MKIKFTFKKEKAETGLRSIGAASPATKIKYKKQEIGYITKNDSALNGDNEGWRIIIQGNDENNINENCPWRWVQFKARFAEEKEARKWINENSSSIYEYLWDEYKK